MSARQTLQRRVAWSATGIAAVVGLAAAAGTVTLMHQALRNADDRRLREAAQLFANEMGDTVEIIAPRANDEADELKPVGIRLGVFAANQRIGGVNVHRAPTLEGCSTDDANQRACALAGAAGTVIVTEAQASELPVEVLAMVAAAVALLASLGGLLASQAVARWALEPLHALQRRLAEVALDGQLELGPPAATAEVEAFRQALTALVTRLREASERSRVFATSAAHELRTPLATLCTELELAMRAEPAPTTHEAMARALRTVHRLSVLVDHLLLLAREQGATFEPSETLAVEDVVRETVAKRSTAERARLVMHFDDAGMVRGDSVLLSAIVDNLTDNALKYSAGPVDIRVSAAPGHIVLELHDTGPGLSPEQFAQLKQPFARGPQSAVAGHGLGLAIVHHAVNLHRGQVTFDGPLVRVRLPAWAPTPA